MYHKGVDALIYWVFPRRFFLFLIQRTHINRPLLITSICLPLSRASTISSTTTSFPLLLGRVVSALFFGWGHLAVPSSSPTPHKSPSSGTGRFCPGRRTKSRDGTSGTAFYVRKPRRVQCKETSRECNGRRKGEMTTVRVVVFDRFRYPHHILTTRVSVTSDFDSIARRINHHHRTLTKRSLFLHDTAVTFIIIITISHQVENAKFVNGN